jgi:membrane-associated phospholipid phosphatase
MNSTHEFDRAAAGAHLPLLRRWAGNVIDAFALLFRPARLHPRDPWPLPLERFFIAGGLALVTFLLVMFICDAAAINVVGHLPHFVPWAFDQITDFGKSGWFLWPLGILFLMMAALPAVSHMAQSVLTALMVRIGFLFLAISLPGLFVNMVKHIVGRARPGVGGSIDPFLFNPFSWPAAYASLPSGHAATAFSVLVAFGTLWPRARAILWIYALAIGASRVAVTAHYPSDVLAGAVVGAAGALMVRRYFALRRLGFSVTPDGAVRVYPGPSLKRIKSVARALLA